MIDQLILFLKKKINTFFYPKDEEFNELVIMMIIHIVNYLIYLLRNFQFIIVKFHFDHHSFQLSINNHS